MIGSLLLIAAAITPTDFRSQADQAESQYRAGLSASDDAAKARPLFRAAAETYEALWQAGLRNERIARNMAQAHLLAGDLAQAIRAYHLGLQLAPDDAELQTGLAYARNQIAYPSAGNLAAACRPRSHWSLRTYASVNAYRGIALLLYLTAMFALARARMTRWPAWLVAGITLFVFAVVVIGSSEFALSQWEEESRRPLVVVSANGTALRYGNGAEYPLRFNDLLPAGVEMHLLRERGGWFQVMTADGSIGWVEMENVVRV